jgi:hypothetical protein
MSQATTEQLNARAFGEDPVETKVDNKEDTSEKATAEAPQAKSAEKKEEATSEPDGDKPESVVEEQKVPYSRLKTAIERTRTAEREAEEARSRYEELSRERSSHRDVSREPYEEAIASRIKKLYGDNETSKEIIEIELERSRQIEELAERKAYEAYDRRESTSKSEIEANERNIDRKLEDLSLTLGRDITSEEEEEVLSIADQYSPVGEDGKYLSGEPLPLDRAWEIYEMKQASKGLQSKKARSQATAATSSKSDGETEVGSKDSDTWYPGRWRDRLRMKS